MARPQKFNPDAAGRVLTAIAGGATRRIAAAYAGISDSLLYEWLERGRNRRQPEFVEFLEGIKKAEADALVDAIAIIRKAARDHWQAAAWYLERKAPLEFGRQDRATIADEREAAKNIAIEYGLTPEEAERILADIDSR